MCEGERAGKERIGRGQEGFTMVDLLLGLFLAGILVTVLGSFLTGALRVQSRVQDRIQVQRDGNVALEHLVRRLSLAGLNIDPEAGEEPFPALPPTAGGDWGEALAIQYRPEGSPTLAYAYYLDEGRLMERGADGRSVALTGSGSRVTSLSFTYFGDDNVPLVAASLANGSRRLLIRRVRVTMELERDNPSEVQPYRLETTVTLSNLKH